MIQQFPTIKISGDDKSDHIREEIDLVIRSEVSAIASERYFSSETEGFLLKQLLSIENRTYLWLHLILDQIRNSDNASNEKAIQKEIQTIPQSVSRAYEAILAKAKDKKLASKLLHIIVGAETALTLQDLNVAMSIEDNSRCYADLELEDATAFELRIKSICRLFVYTDRSRVFLIHQTAKEFLRWNHEVSEPRTGLWEHSLRPEDSSSLLAGICVSLLMFEDFETDPLSAEGLDHPVSTAQYEQYCDSHALLRYAARCWPKHLKSSPVELQKTLVQKTAHLCNTISQRCWTWLRVKRFAEDGYQPSGFTDLILASELGLVALVKHLLLTGIDVNAKDNEGASPLNRAVGGRNHEVVRVLLDNGAHIEADWDQPWHKVISENGSEHKVPALSGRPLMTAAMNDDHTMMRMLITAGADLEAQEYVGTALHYAALFGRHEAVRILLENGADVNARNGELGTLLHQEAAIGAGQIVAQLLDHGVDVNTENEEQDTPLHLAADAGRDQIVTQLLDHGADVNARNIAQETPLHLAAESGRDQIVAQLLDHGADVNVRDGEQQTPLHRAAAAGRDQVVAQLIDHGADVSARNGEQETPLYLVAAAADADQIVTRLLDCDIDVYLRNGELKTSLYQTAWKGRDQIVTLLLDHGVDVNARNKKQRTPLHGAVVVGRDQIVTQLLDHGADFRCKTKAGHTALDLATNKHQQEVISLLLARYPQDSDERRRFRTRDSWQLGTDDDGDLK